jgi:hypothetical protein
MLEEGLEMIRHRVKGKHGLSHVVGFGLSNEISA